MSATQFDGWRSTERLDMNENVTSEIQLSTQEWLFALFARVFGAEPDKELINDLVLDETLSALALFLNDEELKDFAAMQDSLKASLLDDDFFERLGAEYFKALEAPGKMIAYPWESVYAEGAPLLFQKSTLSVIEAYRQDGFELELTTNVPKDHISYELLFMSLLASQNKTENMQRFKDAHLINWVPSYCDDLQKLPDSEYICAIARTLKAFLKKA